MKGKFRYLLTPGIGRLYASTVPCFIAIRFTQSIATAPRGSARIICQLLMIYSSHDLEAITTVSGALDNSVDSWLSRMVIYLDVKQLLLLTLMSGASYL